MPANADGLEIIEPAQLNADGFEIIPPPKVDLDKFGLNPAVHLNDDGFQIVGPSREAALFTPAPATHFPTTLETIGALHQNDLSGDVEKQMRAAGYSTRLPGDLEAPEQDAFDRFKQTTLGQKLFGEGQPEELPASDIQRKGAIGTLLSVPARVAGFEGKLAKAAVGDVAAPSQENLQALFRHEETLPIERTLQAAKAEDKEQGILGWQTIAGDISLGLADLAPKIMMLEAASTGTAPAAAGAIFGFDDKGSFSPSGAAAGVLLPYVSKATGDVVDAAVKKAVERGFIWAGQPSAQASLHVAANQAAMNTVMGLQDSPQLIQLWSTDPQEFKREVAKLLGSNLAFAIPEALKQREPVTQTSVAAEGAVRDLQREGKLPVTKDLAAELQAAMTGNQVRQNLSSPEPNAQPVSTQADLDRAVADTLMGKAVREITGQIPGAKITIEGPSQEKGKENAVQERSAGTLPVEEPSGDRGAMEQGISQPGEAAGAVEAIEREIEAGKPAAAGESGAPKIDLSKTVPLGGLTAEEQEALRRELDEELGQTEKQPASSGSDGVNQSVQTEPNGPETTVTEAPAAGKRVGRGLRARTIFDRETEMNGPDILNWIIDSGGMLSKTAAKKNWGEEKYQANKSLWDDAPPLRKPHHNVIYNPASTRAPDQVAQAAYDEGQLSAPDVNELWAQIDKASKTRSHAYEQQRRHEKILQEEIEQNKRWRQAKATGDVRVDAEDLQPGDTMELAGERLKVTEKDPETGDVTVEDGSKFGRQRLQGGDSVYVEKMGDELVDRLAEEPPPYRIDPFSKGAQFEQREQADDRNVQRREQAADTGGRNAGDLGEQGRENPPAAPAGALRPAAAPADQARLEWLRGELAREKEQLAQSPQSHDTADQGMSRARTGYPTEPGGIGAFAGIHYLQGQIEILTSPRAAHPDLAALERDRSYEMGQLEKSPRDPRTQLPQTLSGVQRLGRIRYLEGMIDEMLRIQEADAAKNAPGRQDLFEQWLDRAIAKTDPLAGGKMLEGVTGAPVWLTKTLANGALRVLRATYRAGKNLRVAIEEALLWLHDQRVKGFDAHEGREWLTSVIAEHKGDVERAAAESFADLNEEPLKLEPEREGENAQPEKQPPPPASFGRSLDELTDWLKQHDINSPRRSLNERLALGKRLAEAWQGARDAFDKARTNVAAAWRTGLEAIKHPPIDTDFRNAVKEWIFYDTWTGAQTRRWIEELKSKVENPLRRMAMSVWLEAGGDEALLRKQLGPIPDRWKPAWQRALELTPDEKGLAQQIKADFARKLEDAKTAGLIEKGRKDYGVPQVWSKAPEPLELTNDAAFATANGPHGSPGNWAAKLDPRDPFFSFQREVPTYFDGIMAGGVPKSLDVADLVGVYNEAFHKALSSRAAIWAMKNGTARDGLPLVKISGSARLSKENEPGTYFIDSNARRESDVTDDGRPYRPIDHFAMRDWKVAHKTPGGEMVFVRGDMLVHPDHYEFLKNELLKSPLREGSAGRAISAIRQSSLYLKGSKLALGTFHLATVAEHAVFHWVNPFTNGFEIDLRNPDQAGLVKGGTELGMSGPQAAFEEGLASHSGLFNRIPLVGDLSRKFSDWLFKDYIPALKMKTALDILARNRKRYGKELSAGQIFELTSNQVNAAFGLQNYRLLGRSKVLMDLTSLGALAPDFLESRMKVVAQALKPYGAEQRRMLFAQAVTLYVGARLLNAWLDDDPHWDPKLAFNLVVKGRAYGLRTIVGDMWHMLTDPKSFAAGRLAPLARIAIETITQRDLRTGARKEPPIQTEWMPGRVAQNLVVDLAKWLLPVGSEGLLPGAAGREQGPMSTLLSSVGIGSHKYTATTEVAEWARDFNRKGDAHARTYQRQLDAEPHGEGTYRKLDALLDAGKLDQAATEYRALIQDGHSDKSIESHYERSQPFTGNKAREQSFLDSLSDRQKAVYQRALTEKRLREQALRQMIERARAAVIQ